MFFRLFQSVFQLPYLRIRKTSTHRGAPLRSFRQTIFRNSFLLLIHLLFQGYILHRPMKYIFIGSCSIYSTADAVYIHFSKVLSCTACSACRAFGAMRFWPRLMMQASLGCLPGVRGDEVLAAVDDAGKLGAFPPVELFFILYSGAVSSGFSHCRKSRMFGSSR